ncbi:MAG: aldose epimerase family protein [Enterococcus sp.]
MDIKVTSFGDNAQLYSLENDHGYKLQITNFGARIVNLFVPTSTGERNIVLGFDSAEEYLEKDAYMGATIGRVAGRIADGKFQIGAKSYKVATQKDHQTLHGGPHSFEEKYWDTELVQKEDAVQVLFSLTSFDEENGFPGELSAMVSYTLTNENKWKLEYQATTDQPTLYNPTNHVYFNLTGDVTQSVAEHKLTLKADRFAPIGEEHGVLGEILSVENTPFDFQTGARLTQVFDSKDPQVQRAGGLDHPFFFADSYKGRPAVLESPDSQVRVTMASTEPAVVIFTAQFGDEPIIMHGKQLATHGGITLETQVAPGATEFKGFGNILLNPEDYYTSATTFLIETN